MTNFRFEYSENTQITAKIAEDTNDSLWVAFAQNSSGNCILEKQFPFSPTQTFFTLTKSVDEINSLAIDSTNLYASYTDSTLLGEIFPVNNPSSSTTISIPAGINESPVDILIDGSDLWYLIPGDISGENTKLLKYNTSGVLQDTIDLSKTGLIITNANKMVLDTNEDIRISTYTNPATIVRVFESSPSVYDFSQYTIS